MSGDSNPVVLVGNEIPVPPLPEIVRDQYSRIDFLNEIMAVYGPGINPTDEASINTIVPDAPRSTFFWRLEDAFNETGALPPTGSNGFITDGAWEIMKNSPSGFLTGVSSIMPKLMVPSKLLVDNGAIATADKEAWNPNNTQGFNWFGLDVDDEDFELSGNYGSRLVSIKKKNDIGQTSNEISLDEQLVPPTGDWNPVAPLVGVGAFVLVLNVVPTIPGGGSATDAENKWSVGFTFGEVNMTVDDSGALTILINGNTTKAQLCDSQAKESPPQVSQLKGTPLTLVVYPVWNGIVVSSGIQDVRNVVKVSSQYCVKTQGTNINSDGYMLQGKGGTPGVFDVKNPDDVFIKVTDDVKVNMGGGGDEADGIVVNAKNCRYELAYLPLFFSPAAILDTFFVAQKDQSGPPNVVYTNIAWPVWTDNDAPYQVGGSLNTQNSIDDVSEWKYINFQFSADEGGATAVPNRRAGELFSYILNTKETREVTTETSNGSFDLVASGGTPAGPSGSWSNYIKSISTTISLDGLNGQVVVDKYGFSGQTSRVVQDIGAITLNVTNSPSGSYSGLIFSGLGMGISDNTSIDGGDFTVALDGLNKKIEDIVLINVPFFDGEPLGPTIEFLCKFAGITADLSQADEEYILPASDNIQSPLIDFKTGTTVGDALNQLMTLSAHSYLFKKDGQCHFYKLENNGLPSTLGPDYSGSHPSTRMISYDTSPDFEDLRNEIFAVGFRKVEVPRGSNLDSAEDILFPLIVGTDNPTTPEIPWSKGLVFGVPGVVTKEKLDETVENLKSISSSYRLVGRTTVPGDSRLEPYQAWKGYVIASVTQNVDLQGKTWTTDIEFMSYP